MAHILIFDDDRQLRSSIRIALEATGHHVVEAAHGEHGLRLQRQQPADLIICDIFMPENDGLQIIRELRRFGTACTTWPYKELTQPADGEIAVGVGNIVRELPHWSEGADGPRL
jgi:CheY-like chemotaxis protein